MSSELVNVGVVGLGIMGGAMAKNLIAADFSVVGFDPDKEAQQSFTKAGGSLLSGPGDVAREADIVITSLPSIGAFQAVMKDIAAGGTTGTIIVECGTLPIEEKEAAKEQLDKAGIILLDCPLSGTGAQAAVKDMVILASGDKDAIDKCQPVFDAIGRGTHNVGEFGAGMKMKFVANHLVTINNLATAEALVLARMAGLDAQQTFDVIADSAATSRMWEIRGPMMVDRTYEPATMKMDIYVKDLQLICDFARKLNCPVPLFTASEPLYSAARAQGRNKEDTAAVNAVLESMAGILPESSDK